MQRFLLYAWVGLILVIVVGISILVIRPDAVGAMITGTLSSMVPASAAIANRVREMPEVRKATSSLAAARPPTPARKGVITR